MLNTTPITERVLQYYRESIASGRWKVGERIPSEHQLTELLGVSRASIRAATQQLIGMGILASYQGKGTFLLDSRLDDATRTQITAQDCKDALMVLEFRRIVEPEACRLAAMYADDALLQQLEAHLETMRSHVKDLDIFTAADAGFHQAICDASHNPLLIKSVNSVLQETFRNQRTTYVIGGPSKAIAFHESIYEAIRARDPAAAKRAMEINLQSSLDDLTWLTENAN